LKQIQRAIDTAKRNNDDDADEDYG